METTSVKVSTHGANKSIRVLDFKNGWFNGCEFFTFKINEEYNELHVSKHYLDVPKGAFTGSIDHHRIIFKVSLNIELGVYDVDKEESDEDLLIIPLD